MKKTKLKWLAQLLFFPIKRSLSLEASLPPVVNWPSVALYDQYRSASHFLSLSSSFYLSLSAPLIAASLSWKVWREVSRTVRDRVTWQGGEGGGEKVVEEDGERGGVRETSLERILFFALSIWSAGALLNRIKEIEFKDERLLLESWNPHVLHVASQCDRRKVGR